MHGAAPGSSTLSQEIHNCILGPNRPAALHHGGLSTSTRQDKGHLRVGDRNSAHRSGDHSISSSSSSSISIGRKDSRGPGPSPRSTTGRTAVQIRSHSDPTVSRTLPFGRISDILGYGHPCHHSHLCILEGSCTWHHHVSPLLALWSLNLASSSQPPKMAQANGCVPLVGAAIGYVHPLSFAHQTPVMTSDDFRAIDLGTTRPVLRTVQLSLSQILQLLFRFSQTRSPSY